MEKCTIDALGRITISPYMQNTLKFFEGEAIYVSVENGQIILTKEQPERYIDMGSVGPFGKIHIPRYIALSKRLIDYSEQTEWEIPTTACFDKLVIYLSEEQRDLRIRLTSRIDELNRIYLPKKIRKAFGIDIGSRLALKSYEDYISLLPDPNGTIEVTEICLIELPKEFLKDAPLCVELKQRENSIDVIKIMEG
ncbi:MAG: AbrB/MazE/SpoVT family DNA-binding domain-containing protein [Tepidanaerobacteraceae bacterium]|nr:AbrB/MazE/SpoVT family DNA-binding domain-containing protein [Bacteroidales bacterium]MDD4570814.1 AbrB/MazE/SpoVT family DNA-binding domain-containing protein [Tepidanaerobacteraceae bacterium]